MLDRVKQALFDALGVHFGTLGGLPPLHVLDAYCGGGTLGIESLSRGAADVLFIDAGSDAIDCLKANLAALKLQRVSRILHEPAEDASFVPTDGPFDLIFADPPFPMNAAVSDAGSPLRRFFNHIVAERRLTPEGICIWRFERDRPPPATLDSWTTLRERHYGRSTLRWMRLPAVPGDGKARQAPQQP